MVNCKVIKMILLWHVYLIFAAIQSYGLNAPVSGATVPVLFTLQIFSNLSP